MAANQLIQLFADGDASATFETPLQVTDGIKGLILTVDVDSVSAADTLDVKVQEEVGPFRSGDFVDIDGAVMAQFAAAGQQVLVIYPGITEVANKQVGRIMPFRWRVVFTLAGASITINFKCFAEVIF